MNRKQRLKYTSSIISKVAVHATKSDKNAVFKVLFEGFSHLGGVYVKFLQILSARAEFKDVTSVSMRDRTNVFDNVKPDNIDIHRVFEHEIGSRYKNELHDIQTAPFAAGSFGQVYFARHVDGTPVIIKILRPSLLQYIKFDLKVLRIILRLINSSPFARTYDLKDVFKDFKDVVLTETDYPREVQNAMYFYEYFKDHPNIVIPKSYPELSSRNIIVQEFITGIPMTDLLILHDEGHDVTAHIKKELGSDLHVQLYALGHELLYSTLAAAKIPGDPHAGNIKLLPDNKIGLFDFGITAEPPNNRLAFKGIIVEYTELYNDNFDAGRLFVTGMKFFANRQFRAINTVATVVKAGDSDFDLLDELQIIVNKVLKQNKGKVDAESYIKNAKIAPLFREAINEDNRFALDIEFDGTVMLKAADTYIAMLDRMGLKNELNPMIYQSVLTRIETSGINLQGKSDLMDLEQAIEIVSSWMQDLVERDPIVFHGMVSKVRKGLSGQKKKDKSIPVDKSKEKSKETKK